MGEQDGGQQNVSSIMQSSISKNEKNCVPHIYSYSDTGVCNI